jgi:plastocyanin
MGAAFALALSLAACSSTPSGGGGATPTAAGGGASPTVAETGNVVTIKDFAFNPADLTVKAGTTVTWTQKDSVGHFVKWGDGTAPGATLALDQTYTRKFDTAGTFTYVCGIHGTMHGSITVTP